MKSKLLIGFSSLALVACSPSAQQLYEEANAHFIKNQFEEAIPLFEQVQLKDANNSAALAKLAMSYAYTQQWQKCSETGEQAFARKLDLLQLYLQVSECFAMQKKADKALSLLQEGLKRYPGDQDLKERAAMLLFGKGDYALSVSYFKELSEQLPEREDFLTNIAYGYEKLKKYAEAESYFQKVLAINAQDANAFYGLGNLFEHQNQISKAIDHYQKAIKANGSHLSALYNLAQLYEQEKMKTEAIATWKKYIEVAKGQPSQKSFLDKAIARLKKLEGGTA
ncbi:hypothetical protein COW36_24070 [bacterium (Candidatus Blackallbacteria) CG17_big_fil_post_rev_8_21_14_2_50_48_46]|uniref:Uncharacterized protein n=1 Tax=bacterium (Candidatus Blackallbacteria) CG17_big_fil_post_rev_8_21_14_2_50_48_46 TaxID=2014261 RepID=A0A2M7FWW3_9BACT|nr:MAG: hypothetical protein COW64_19010 [bacterium (Candidatus Blackallbacteria) CG18_big_fil_WC_8_21_14_2_50_49_26]PIW13748.1 MAG: hypothetical protein COW36_24070 [bacterium (Candidatus Blackallbacteria) CG17_big_fil_post_rev_8_21_14_2_50_48_46]PIW44974.1 MAG: hypothetical protein COW20_21700 [bacterium (Candidatus Blackallbacteria) CG13_big_fil_rev_8_21_14_2_50_49_14]